MLSRAVSMNPSERQRICHNPKAILMSTGEHGFPHDWSPKNIDTQIFRIGDVLVLGLPAEFTTMAGRQDLTYYNPLFVVPHIYVIFRRMRREVREAVATATGTDSPSIRVALAGLANVYGHYVTTKEEYQDQVRLPPI